MFDDLITHRTPPPNRVGLCNGGHEQHLPEGAVMVAFAMHLLERSQTCAKCPSIRTANTASDLISKAGLGSAVSR